MSESADSTADTLDHIGRVQTRLAQIQTALDQRAAMHDRSKLREPEKAGYDRLTQRLAGVAYGSEAYYAALEEAKGAIAHHYAHNTHHPEHFENGVAGMSLLDIIEMLADQKARSERTSLAESMAHNQQRFGIGDQLAVIIINTIRELGW